MMRNRRAAVALCAAAMLLSGCGLDKTHETFADKIAAIKIPYQWFRHEGTPVKEKPIVKVTGMNMNREGVDIKGLRSLSEKVAIMGRALSDHNDYLDIASGKKSIFQVLGSEILSLDYGSGRDGLTETIQDFAKTQYQWIDSITLRQYGVRIDQKGKRTKYAVVDVNGVNDTKKFHIQTLQLRLDETGHPVSAIRIQKPEDLPHTRTPLTKNSFLESSTHQDFALAWERMRASLADPALYNRIASGKIKAGDHDIKALTRRLGLKEENQSALFSLLTHGRGTFNHWAITGYLYDDTNLNATTLYELTVADETGIYLYTIHYQRGTKTITQITKGSPFKGE